jgi:hypothetical protein
VNACTQDLRCHLNETLFTPAPPAIPSWVPANLTKLVSSTLQDAKAGTLGNTPVIGLEDLSGTRYGLSWYAGMTCSNSTHGTMWAVSCGERSGLYNTNFGSGYASLGFHPLGLEPGTWLTQILMPVVDTPGYTGGFVASCVAAEAYINIDKISDNTPLDLWEQRMAGYPTVSAKQVVAWRTDNDLLKNGLKTRCRHFDCPDIGHKTQLQLSIEDTPGNKNLTCDAKTSSAISREMRTTFGVGALGWISAFGLLHTLAIV